MITHHTFLHNKVSIFPQHNNIKIKIHIKSRSQQTKLVLNVDFEGEGTCPAGLFPPAVHTQWRLLGAGWRQQVHPWLWQLLGQTSALVPGLIVCPVCTQGALSSSPCATMQGARAESSALWKVTRGRRSHGSFWPGQFIAPLHSWSHQHKSEQWARAGAEIPVKEEAAPHQDLVATPVAFGIVASVTFAACPASWGDC